VTDFAGQLRRAFPAEPVPAVVVDDTFPCDPDRDDAVLLQGLAWPEVAADFWRDHWWGLTSLLPEAFVYYLPSLLEISIKDGLPYDMPRKTLIHTLDTSADLGTIPNFTLERMLILSSAQFDCVEAWCGIVAAKGWFDDRLQQERVELTVMVLREEAQRRPNPPAPL
jgi:hypothetical protein